MMTSDSKDEAAFLLRRAEEEAILALRSDQPVAEAAHQQLSLRYSVRAREMLAEMPAAAE